MKDRRQKRTVMTSELTSIELFALLQLPEYVSMRDLFCARVQNRIYFNHEYFLFEDDKRAKKSLFVCLFVL
jgi:hypothetical protein